MSNRKRRYLRDVLHQASNALVDGARRYDCDVIAFENRTDIRDRTDASWGHSWAFRTLYEYVEYKAEAVGIAVRQVDPSGTSMRCSECGFTDAKNRPARTNFQCRSCGMQANADYNAAKNIELRYVRSQPPVVAADGRQSPRPEVRNGDAEWRIYRLPGGV